MKLVQRQAQIRYIRNCQVCLAPLPRPVKEDSKPHPLALITCGKESCYHHALECWKNIPSGVVSDDY